MKRIKLRKIKNFVRGFLKAVLLSGRYHRREKALKRKYYVDSEKKGIQTTQVVVMVDGRYLHGGLCDRLRGIAGVYGYCKERKIPFYLHYVYPFRLETYLEPNRCDWRIGPDQISYHPQEALPVVLTVRSLQSKMHRLYLNRIIAAYPHRQLHVYTNTVLNDKHFSMNFSDLFKPSLRLQEAISDNLLRIGSSYVAMVFRFQQLLGDFKEGYFPTLSPEEGKRLMQTCIDKVDEIHSLRHPDAKVLVTSDSVTFLETVQRQLAYVDIIPGKVVHVDFTLNAENDVYLKSFLDLFMLSKARKVYLFQTGNMYHSGFAKRAAKIEDVPYEEIIF
ncbi:MAG: hypothetical protein Q4D56_01865 [Bacteroides sp.]|nr:hypothetical protein [Bacteroides sp.]